MEDENPSRSLEKLRSEIANMAREIDDLKALASRSEKRQVLIDAFHEERDQLQRQITGMSSKIPRKEAFVDIAGAVVQSYDLSQIESNKKRDEEVSDIMEAFEKVKTRIR